MNSQQYDVIVLDLDGEATMLRDCLQSIVAQSVPPSTIVLLDNGSRIPTLQRLGDLAGSVELIRLEANVGFAAGVNRAWGATGAPLIALINNDVVLEREWGAALLELISSDVRCAAVQSVILQREGELVDGAGIALEEGRIGQLGHGVSARSLETSAFRGVSATATLYRKSAVKSVAIAQAKGQVFDERFGSYYEDVDLAARLRGGGFSMQLLARPLARHRGSASATQLGGRADILRTRNRYLVARRHGPAVARKSALLNEDLRRIGRALLTGRLGMAWRVVRGVAAGLTAPVD